MFVVNIIYAEKSFSKISGEQGYFTPYSLCLDKVKIFITIYVNPRGIYSNQEEQ